MSEDFIKLFSGMVLRHTKMGDSTSNARQSGLLELPNELLIPILKELSHTELLSLAFLCRRLHLLVVPIYLARIDALDDRTHFSTDKISLRCARFAETLSLLQRSLCITSIKHLTCQFPSPDSRVLGEVRLVHRLVSRLSSVNEITLDFERYYSSQSSVKLAEWGVAFGDLLKVLSDKSCTVFTIKHGDQPANSFHPSATSLFTKRKSPLIARPFIAVKNFRKSFIPMYSGSSSFSRTSLAKAAFPISALNGTHLTSLSIEYMRLRPPAWAAILSNVTFPMLSELRARCIQVALGDLFNFLSRHPLITVLELAWLSGPDPATSRPPKFVLPHLKTINADIHIVSHLLSTKLPSLESISVPLSLTFKKHESELTEVGLALVGLANRKDDIALHLSVSMEFDAIDRELTGSADETVASKEPERWQTLVKSIVFNTGVQHPALTEGAVKFLPPWLGRWFTAVEHLSIGYDCVCICPYHRITFGSCRTLTQMLRTACPKMKDVTINGLTYVLD